MAGCFFLYRSALQIFPIYATMNTERSEKSDRMKNKNIRFLPTLLLCTALSLGCVHYTVGAASEGAVVPEDNHIEYVGDAADRPDELSDVEALDVFDNGMNYSAVIYDYTNGMPTSEANAITQTGDGFIWIGGYGGLVRYDGNTFKQIPLDGITGIEALYTDSKDRIWIGSANNRVAVMEKGGIRYWNEKNGFLSGSAEAIAEDGSGIVYFGTDHGLAFSDEKLNMNPIDDKRISSKHIIDLKQGSDGLVYGLEKNGYVFTLKDGSIQQYKFSGCTDPVCLLPDPERSGYLYISDRDSQIYGSFEKDDPKIKAHESLSNLLLNIKNMEYVGGMIWYCAGKGVCACSPSDKKHNYYLQNMPMSNSIGHVMQDYQGNYWFTSSRQGVMKVVPNYFDDLCVKSDVTRNVVNSTCLYQDKLVIGTDTGIEVIDQNGKKSPMTVSGMYYDNQPENEFDHDDNDLYDYFDRIRIRSLFLDSKNMLWISTWGRGLYCIDGTKAYRYDADGRNAPISSNQIRTVAETKDNSILVVGENGLDIMKDKKTIKSYGEKDNIQNPSFLCVAEGPDGDILLGSDGNGIYIIDKNGDVRNLDREDGLTSGSVMRIKKDRTRNIFWIVTENSIAYMTEDYKISTVTKFPYANNFDLYQNSRDEMWIMSSNGIYVVSTEKMIDNEDITPVHYGTANGLTHITTPVSYSELTEKGDLYISGNTGVTKVNIETAFQDVPEIKAAVPYVDADEKRLYPDENGCFNISSDVRKLTVYSYVLNYSLTTPRVSYCLEGFDNDYVAVSRSYPMPVDYTNLSGGKYRFVLKVTDSNGDVYTTVAADIIREKVFYEEIWFYIVLAIFNLLILAVALQIIWVIRMKKLRKKHKEEIEKERINTELLTAGKIQTGSMPAKFPPFPDRKEFDIYASMDPAKEVGGDFYDFFLTDSDHLCIVMADVSGKGIPAALFMMSAKIMISDFAEIGKTPSEILMAVNAKLSANNPQKMFVTVWLGILELSTGRLTAANAGHEYPVLMQPNGKFEILKDDHGPMVCFMKKIRYKEYEICLKPGARLFLYTDGIPEASDSNEQMFGMDRLVDTLNEKKDASLNELLESVRCSVDSFVMGAEQFDDITMLCLEYKGTPKNTDDDETSRIR